MLWLPEPLHESGGDDRPVDRSVQLAAGLCRAMFAMDLNRLEVVLETWSNLDDGSGHLALGSQVKMHHDETML